MPASLTSETSATNPESVDAAVLRSLGSKQYGVTDSGYVPKPFARVLAEKLALARELFGPEIDLTSGSAIRKLLEISALEDARTWSALHETFQASFISTAQGQALDSLGAEIGISRPHENATGSVTIEMKEPLPGNLDSVEIPVGSRLVTPGGHHAFTTEAIFISLSQNKPTCPVAAYYPGPSHNLDPAATDSSGENPQKLSSWNSSSDHLPISLPVGKTLGDYLEIIHEKPLTGGEMGWTDERYRRLLLNAPRSLWTADAIRLACSLVPGVRSVQVHDGLGGLDIKQSIFGNFNFIERLFSTERDLANPYYLTITIAKDRAAIWDGHEGLKIAIEAAIEDIRPISIFPKIQEAERVAIAVEADIKVRGIPMPSGTRQTINTSEAAIALKNRILTRIDSYISNLSFGQPIRASEITWAIMSEPGIADVQNLTLIQYPKGFHELTIAELSNSRANSQIYSHGRNVPIQATQIAELITQLHLITIN